MFNCAACTRWSLLVLLRFIQLFEDTLDENSRYRNSTMTHIWAWESSASSRRRSGKKNLVVKFFICLLVSAFSRDLKWIVDSLKCHWACQHESKVSGKHFRLKHPPSTTRRAKLLFTEQEKKNCENEEQCRINNVQLFWKTIMYAERFPLPLVCHPFRSIMEVGRVHLLTKVHFPFRWFLIYGLEPLTSLHSTLPQTHQITSLYRRSPPVHLCVTIRTLFFRNLLTQEITFQSDANVLMRRSNSSGKCRKTFCSRIRIWVELGSEVEWCGARKHEKGKKGKSLI